MIRATCSAIRSRAVCRGATGSVRGMGAGSRRARRTGLRESRGCDSNERRIAAGTFSRSFATSCAARPERPRRRPRLPSPPARAEEGVEAVRARFPPGIGRERERLRARTRPGRIAGVRVLPSAALRPPSGQEGVPERLRLGVTRASSDGEAEAAPSGARLEKGRPAAALACERDGTREGAARRLDFPRAECHSPRSVSRSADVPVPAPSASLRRDDRVRTPSRSSARGAWPLPESDSASAGFRSSGRSRVSDSSKDSSAAA